MSRAQALLVVLLTGCATPAPERPPEVRTQTVTVAVPVPVPCFTEAERPHLPPPTPIDIENATVDQLAAALAADKLAEEIYTAQVDALFIKCLKGTAP